MEEFRNICDATTNPRPVPMVSPVSFDSSLDSNYFAPISNQLQTTSPDMFWQYPTTDHRQSPYPNTYNYSNAGQCTYWPRNSSYPTVDQMLMSREWTSPSPDNCSYQVSPWSSMEQAPMVQNMNIHAMNHGIPQWPTGSARASLDFSTSGDSSLGEIVMSVCSDLGNREDHSYLEHDVKSYSNTNGGSGLASILRQTSTPLAELPLEDKKYNSCRWQTDATDTSNGKATQTDFKLKHKSKKKEYSKECKEAAESHTKLKVKKDKNTTNNTEKVEKKKSSRSSSRKPEAYKRQKKLQREREGQIRNAIQELNMILPAHDDDKKLSKNMILLRAIEHIYQLKVKLGETVVKELQLEISESEETLSPKTKKKKKNKNKKRNQKDLKAASTKKTSHMTSKSNASLQNNGSSQQTQATTTNCNNNEPMITDLLTPSESSFGSESMESSSNEDSRQEEYRNHIKRPMNAFMLFSKANREKFKKLYPGRDNRRISSILGEHWKAMSREDKVPFQEMARDLMRKTKEAYPDFKYSPSDQPKVGADGSSKEGSPKHEFKIGSHLLRHRQGRENCLELKPSSAQVPAVYEPGITPNTTTETMNLDPSANIGIQVHTDDTAFKPLVIKPRARRIQSFSDPKGYTYFVQCDKCTKWRRLSDGVNPASLPDKWYCWLSTDPRVYDCSTDIHTCR